jgi:HAMP domain-containing protein
MPDEPRKGNHNLPVPDPTLLTTQALEREVEVLRDIIDREIRALRELVFDRIKGHGIVCDEKFARVERQFHSVESLRLEQKKDTKDAVDAALTSQKEAVFKSETSMTGRLEQLSQTVATQVDSLRREIGDTKERIGEVASQAEGIVQQKAGAKEDRTGLYASVGVIFVVITIVLSAIAILVGNN